MSVKSKHSASKKEKTRKKEKREKLEELEEDMESSEEELDLTKKCHSIGHYVNDRAEMINQMFSVIKGNKLRAMLPPILKDCDIEQLKLQCLDQLLGMSEKRITCILEGEILETSSESDVPESDEGDSDEKKATSSDTSSEKSGNESAEGDEYQNGSEHLHKKEKRKSDGSSALDISTAAAPEKGKTLLEILELEMRARAIRALLKQGAQDNANDAKPSDSNQNGVSEVTDEIVDLTECEDDEPVPIAKKEPVGEMDIDKKVSNFEEKIEKSQLSERPNPSSSEKPKAKRLRAELELRNKLFKKKIYRTRQQRLENDDDGEKKCRLQDEGVEHESSEFPDVVIKQEPVEQLEPEEVTVEDPEEGEVSTSEDEYPVEIKQEIVEPEVPETEEIREPEVADSPKDILTELAQGAELISAMDDGEFIVNDDAKDRDKAVKTPSDQIEEASGSIDHKKGEDESCLEVQDEDSSGGPVTSEAAPLPTEGNSWRDRWLQKDGVQKLVKSSKILAKVKKRMRIMEKTQRGKGETVATFDDVNSDSNSNSLSKMEVVEGSIEEYARLVGKPVDKSKEPLEVLEEKAEQPTESQESTQHTTETEVEKSTEGCNDT